MQTANNIPSPISWSSATVIYLFTLWVNIMLFRVSGDGTCVLGAFCKLLLHNSLSKRFISNDFHWTIMTIIIYSLTENEQGFELRLYCGCRMPVEDFKFSISGLIIYFSSQMFTPHGLTQPHYMYMTCCHKPKTKKKLNANLRKNTKQWSFNKPQQKVLLKLYVHCINR